jgi:hypothetical protein
MESTKSSQVLAALFEAIFGVEIVLAGVVLRIAAGEVL